MKPRSALLLFCLTSSFVIGFPQLSRADEPVYQNRPLTSWLQDFTYGNYSMYDTDRKADMEKRHAAEEAIRAIGTEALPVLLDQLVISSSNLDYKQRLFTIHAFWVLGAQARPAIPDLIKLLAPAYDAAHQSLSEKSAQTKHLQSVAAASILQMMGKDAIQPLIEALSSKDNKVRFGAAMALGGFYSYPKDVLPSLIKALDDEDQDVRWRAAMSIGAVPQMPELSVPALGKRVLNDPAINVRLYAISALDKFGAEASAALPDLWQATNDQSIWSQVHELIEKIEATQKPAGS